MMGEVSERCVADFTSEGPKLEQMRGTRLIIYMFGEASMWLERQVCGSTDVWGNGMFLDR